MTDVVLAGCGHCVNFQVVAVPLWPAVVYIRELSSLKGGGPMPRWLWSDGIVCTPRGFPILMTSGVGPQASSEAGGVVQ